MSYTKSELEGFGKKASKAFLEAKTPLNDTLAKIALDKSLTPEQIKRACEYANVYTFEAKRRGELGVKKASGVTPNLYIQFPLADPPTVLKSASAFENKRASVIQAQTPDEFFSGVPSEFRVDVLPPGALTRPSELAKMAAEEATDIHLSPEALGRKLVLMNDMRVDIQQKQAEAELGSETQSILVDDIVRELVTDGIKLADVLSAVKTSFLSCGKEEQGRIQGVLARAVEKLSADHTIELGKKVGQAVDAREYIAEEWDTGGMPPVRIINGSHPLFAAIRDHGLEESRVNRFGKALHVLDDKVRWTKKRLADFRDWS